jgi:hypothetical protein
MCNGTDGHYLPIIVDFTLKLHSLSLHETHIEIPYLLKNSFSLSIFHTYIYANFLT